MATTQGLPPDARRSQATTVRKGVPPLDAVAPEKIDTATFGLG